MCLLCGDRSQVNLGPFLTSLNCHYLCVKFSSGLRSSSSPPSGLQPPPVLHHNWELFGCAEDQLVAEVLRAKSLGCSFCDKKGASVKCSSKVSLCLV